VSVAWVVLGFFLSLAAAVVIGWLLYKFLIVGLLIVAFLGGGIIGYLLYNLLFLGWAKSTALLAILTFGFAGAAVVGSFFFRAAIIITVTALIGSYFTLRGISLFAGGFPSEITLYQQIHDGTATYSYTFIGYLVGIAVLFVLGVIF